MGGEALRVVHVAEVRDEEALLALSRTAAVLASAGAEQVLVVLDDGHGGAGPLHESLAPEVRRVSCASLSFFGKVRALQAELRRFASEKPPYAVHLHGAAPCLLGPQALHGAPFRARVLYSPHRRDFAATWAAALLGRLLQSRLAAFHYAPIAGSAAEAETLRRVLRRSAEVLPQPVNEAFFSARREEAPRPAVLLAGTDATEVEMATRLCVLLNGRSTRIAFSWLGPAPAHAAPQLLAAGIALLTPGHERELALAFSRAWIFMQLSSAEGSWRTLAQAMAAAVPCLVCDVATHRALIHHGDTGFLCASERDFLEKLIFLLRHRDERIRMGEAARGEASRRFTWPQFERAVLRVYGFTPGIAPRFTEGLTAPSPAGLGAENAHRRDSTWTSLET